jgi:hypothetical protein
MKNQWVKYAVAILAGYMLKDQIAKLPGVNKLPSV